MPLLEVKDIGKTFPGVRALHRVNFSIEKGEVISLIGENGAGKSTLMKILAGVQHPSEGTIILEGKPITLNSVESGLAAGIALIHQELNLATNLSAGANIFLGREPVKRGFIDEAAIQERAEKYLDMVGLTIDPTTEVGDLTIGKQQLVEIAKALSINAKVLIMDEPTSSLSQKETAKLFDVVDDLRSRGVSVVYISHRLSEVIRLSDRVVVLRDGENAGELQKDEITHDKMVSMMVGRDLSQFYDHSPGKTGKPLLEVKDLISPRFPTCRVNFSIKAGEIVGMAGLVGAGRTEVLETIFGITPALGGSIKIDGTELTIATPREAIAVGLALVPEDRKEQGLVLDMEVGENLSLASIKRDASYGFRNPEKEDEIATKMIDRMRIKTPSANQVVRYLSGGNQQKVVLGKWLAMNPKILFLDEPTRGIDIGAKQEIYALMEELSDRGVAILFVSSEMEEILGMSDRTLVMHEGLITGELKRDELSEEAIMQLATGPAQ
ncbi:MAG: sugar ABC transporter ATP-binding protein [Verrucomicrobiales bacterium]|nr:sugar ABC transporter ATP-binding protein [Verrucomicrobiales bacterium]